MSPKTGIFVDLFVTFLLGAKGVGVGRKTREETWNSVIQTAPIAGRRSENMIQDDDVECTRAVQVRNYFHCRQIQELHGNGDGTITPVTLEQILEEDRKRSDILLRFSIIALRSTNRAFRGLKKDKSIIRSALGGAIRA